MKKIFSNQSGIGLVETLLAIGVAIIVITSMVSLALFTLRASLTNKLALAGTQRANQEIEQVRAYRDSNAWNDFLSGVNGGTGPDCFGLDCHMENGVPAPDIKTEGSGNTALNRSFRLTDVNGDSSLIGVSVTVSWQIGQDNKATHNYTEFSNWRNN